MMTATHAIDVSSDDGGGAAAGLVIGNVFRDPELAERFGLSVDDGAEELEGELEELGADDEEEGEEGDYGARLGYRSRSGLNGYVTMPAAMTYRPRSQSRAAVRRMRGDPGSFVSGALFVDTDGRRVQHGDDF